MPCQELSKWPSYRQFVSLQYGKAFWFLFAMIGNLSTRHTCDQFQKAIRKTYFTFQDREGNNVWNTEENQ